MCSPYSNPRLSAEWRSRLDAEFAAALARGVFSGASLLVAQNRERLFERTWGTVQTGGAPVTSTVRFDLASLTKPMVTAPLCMTAIEKGLLDLEGPLSRFFPGRVPEDKKTITVRSLLSHSSGLPAWAPFYLELVKLPSPERKEALAAMILNIPLDTPPGIAANYSDLGFMLLGLILERIFGASLDSLARDLLFSPLGIEELHFRPLEADAPPSTAAPAPPSPAAILQAGIPAAAPAAAAATQFCPWRKRLLSGEVDDENGWALGGVAGHAGLFGTARGVFQFLSFLWGLYEGDAPPSSFAPAIKARTLRTFWIRSGESDWCLGFDTPSRKGYSSTGRFFTQNAVGHLGFTGVSFWLDLEKRILIILLTNRVHPTRQNDEIRQFRPVLHDLVMKELLHGN
ncbi:MAG: serine hydrolase domain-containing protein [Syntrophobacteraceae bacterium]